MKTNGTSNYRKRMVVAAVCLAIGWLCWSGASAGLAQNAPANLSPGLQEVVKLSQSGLSEDIITSYIKNSGAAYSLSADDLLYLNSQGVSPNVIRSLQQARPSAPPPPAGVPNVPMQPPPPAVPAMGLPDAYVPPVAPPGSDINMAYFQAQLSPFGNWVDLPPYGLVWRPNDAIQMPGWRPYFYQGNWEYTDAGWFWRSDVPYGDIVFHYGRWLRDFRLGWVWVPGYDWAPAWVSWRNVEGFAGWAPLPPAARFEVGVGLMFHGGLALDVDFGLMPDDYVFLGYDHFWDHDYRPFLVPRERMAVLFRGSVVMNGYHIADGRFVVEGLGRERVAAFTHRPVVVEKVVIRDARIDRAREVERTRAVERVQEIQRRPATDPLRRNLDTSHMPDDARRPGGPIPPAAPDRGSPGFRAPDGGTRGGGPEGRDGKDPKEAPGGRGNQ